MEWPGQASPIFLPLIDLGVKGQGQTNVMIICDTTSNGHAHTYLISLTYLERQTSYGPYTLCHLFDLGVKGQCQMNVMMVHCTPNLLPRMSRKL